jgi:predicted negative regulator of RcsB-dependent stress response
MVEEYLTDDEQAEALKSWWRENWAWVFSGIVVGLGLLAGWQYYQRHRAESAESASAKLEQFATAQVSDKVKAEALFKELTDKYSNTPYAIQAQLLQAQHAVDDSDFAAAETALRAVINTSKDKELVQVATMRLARVLVEQGKSDDALALLDPAKAGAFAAQVHEIRGDALLAKHDEAGARSEYQTAMAAFKTDGNADTSLLELKLIDLGGDTPPAATATASAP